ncbi:hypothetical protein AB9K41_01320, partial [Cribrihabitans sp. XS_ASV171]
ATSTESFRKFRDGSLKSNKSISAANKCLPVIGPMYGQLSNDFVHIGLGHASLEGPKIFHEGDQALGFVTTVMRALIVLIEIVADLIFNTENGSESYWKQQGAGWTFDPGVDARAWLERALKVAPVA